MFVDGLNCVSCPVDTYRELGMDNCTECPVNTRTDSDNSTSLSDCRCKYNDAGQPVFFSSIRTKSTYIFMHTVNFYQFTISSGHQSVMFCLKFIYMVISHLLSMGLLLYQIFVRILNCQFQAFQT